MTAAWKAAGLTYVPLIDRCRGMLPTATRSSTARQPAAPRPDVLTGAIVTTDTWPLRPAQSAAASKTTRELLPSAVAKWSFALPSGRYVMTPEASRCRRDQRPLTAPRDRTASRARSRTSVPQTPPAWPKARPLEQRMEQEADEGAGGGGQGDDEQIGGT